MRPTVYSFPPSCSFIDELAERLLAGQLIKGYPIKGDAFSLADMTLFLPNRRLCRQLTETLIEKHQVILLPKILPMGEEDLFDEDEDAYAPVSDLERVLILSRLIRHWGEGRDNPILIHESLGLASELAALLDRFITEDISPETLGTLDIAHDHSDYWQQSLDFLKILTQFWPDILRDKRLVDNATRRNHILKTESERLSKLNKPVIAAGSTGSIKATRLFLKAIASMPLGAVVLPGLDNLMSRDDFTSIDQDHGHPQFGLKRLIDEIGVERLDGVDYPVTPRNLERERLISTALTPASRTHIWSKQPVFDAIALTNLTLIEANDERSEALMLAILIREKYETTKKIAVITPDRALARRLKAELSRWSIEADDSAGELLSETAAVIFLRLYFAALSLNPLSVIAFLTHHASPWSQKTGALSAIDFLSLRGLPPSSISAMKARLTLENCHKAPHPTALITPADLEEAQIILNEFAQLLISPSQTLSSLATHVKSQFLPLLDDKIHGKTELLDYLVSLAGEEADLLTLNYDDYERVIIKLMQATTLRPPFDKNAKLHILGLPEARATDADLVILCGLNEGVWPPQTETDPWLSRAMCARLGLEPPERRIGLSAHDFVQAIGHEKCVLSRSLKKEGNPTIASRWIQRLKAVLPPEKFADLSKKGQDYALIALNIDRSDVFSPAPRPVPQPPPAVRPTKLSVTEIETLIRDPYAIYAKHILKLLPLDGYELTPGARDRGTLIHDILSNYAKIRSKTPLEDPLNTLLALGDKAFEPLLVEPMIQAFWLPRFQKLAENFIRFDENLREQTSLSCAEIGGSLTFELVSKRQFTLTTRTDRIDKTAEGLFIYDYKTGAPPTNKQVKQFLAPQLPLTAIIATGGGFKEFKAGQALAGFGYVNVAGSDADISAQIIDNPQEVTNYTREQFLKLITSFENEAKAYISKHRPQTKDHIGDYDHLARVAEWRNGEEE